MQFRNFKVYYGYVQNHLKHFFPQLVNYNRFIELIKTIMLPLCFLMQSLTGEKTGIYFVDSTPIKVCHIKREKQNKVFKINDFSNGLDLCTSIYIIDNYANQA